jgi:hypothetical protein
MRRCFLFSLAALFGLAATAEARLGDRVRAKRAARGAAACAAPAAPVGVTSCSPAATAYALPVGQAGPCAAGTCAAAGPSPLGAALR